MKAYLSVFRIRFISLLQYRAAALAGIFTQVFFALVLILVMREFFFSSPQQEQPLTLGQTVTYIWLGQAMLGMMPWNGDGEIVDMIRNGDVAYELCRPLGVYEHWYCRLVALRTAPTLLRCLPIFTLAAVLPGDLSLNMPPSAAAVGAWFLATFGALLLGCAISNIISISTLWTLAGEGVQRIIPAAVIFCSGSIVPLAFFPDWAQPVLRFLPFAGLVDVPNQFFIGSMPPERVLPMLMGQLVWTAVLVAAGYTLLAIATKRTVIQGG